MTITNLGALTQPATAQRRSEHWDRPDWRVNLGQTLDLRVVRKLDERRYLVSFAGEQHVVETAMALTAGRAVRTSVTAIGDKLELKYVGPAAPETSQEPSSEAATPDQADVIDDLESRYALTLSDVEQAAIRGAIASGADPELMAGAGLFLSKLSLPVDADALHALYQAQSWSTAAVENAGALRAPNGDEQTLRLAAAMRQILDTTSSSMSPTVAATTTAADQNATVLLGSSTDESRDEGGKRDLASRLLNEQDGGSVAYHYGTLPVLIGDQLVELDLVYFRERARPERDSNTRRLVMTFKTERLGRVQVVAQALAERLSMEITAESSESSAALAAHESEVKDLLTRLGWTVDAVRYELDTSPRRAAGHVIAHVLSADTLNRFV